MFWELSGIMSLADVVGSEVSLNSLEQDRAANLCSNTVGFRVCFHTLGKQYTVDNCSSMGIFL